MADSNSYHAINAKKFNALSGLFSEEVVMSDWAEVHRLASDFQRLQATTTAHRLSERNCVELVTRLVEQGLVEVIYTQDGKEYVTPERLEREIKNELAAHGGRINVVELQQLLNIDLCHIEARVTDFLKRDRSLTLLHGEIIDRLYVQRLCEEINDTVQESGQVSVAELSKNLGLPNSFLVEHIEASMGVKINGYLDKSDAGIIYTESYVNRYRSRIRGLFHAITQPTVIGQLIAYGNFQEKLFNTVLHELIASKELMGALRGRLDKAVYIPYVYTQSQNKWIDTFLSTNGYLEYDALSRLGIDNPQEYISRRYGKEDIIELSTCSVGQLVVTRVEGALEEVLGSGEWVDIMPLLPSPCTRSDAELLLHHVGESQSGLEFVGSVVFTKAFLTSCLEHFGPIIKERAQKVVVTGFGLPSQKKTDGGSVAQEKVEEGERGGGGGGVGKKRGGGGSKGGKKGGKGRGREQPLEDLGKPASWEYKFMTSDEISSFLLEKYKDCPNDFLCDVATKIQSSLQDSFVEEIKECKSAMSQGSSASQHRKKHAELQERVQGLWNMVNLFEKAILLFEESTAVQLSRYLLRTVCSDLFNVVLTFLADDSGITLPSEDLITMKDRSKLFASFPMANMRNKLTALNIALAGKEIDFKNHSVEKCYTLEYTVRSLVQETMDVISSREYDLGHITVDGANSLDLKKGVSQFCEGFEALCMEDYCGIMLKKPDKKKERQLLFSHLQSLLENLRQEWEPSMVLHLATVILFQQNTNCAIHVSGKLLPQVIAFLHSHLQSTQHSKLLALEHLVIKQHRLTTKPRKESQSQDSAEAELTAQEDDLNVSGEGEAYLEPSGRIETSTDPTSNKEEKNSRPSDLEFVEVEQRSLVEDLKKIVIKPKGDTSS